MPVRPLVKRTNEDSAANVTLFDAAGNPVTLIGTLLPAAAFITDFANPARKSEFDPYHSCMAVVQIEHQEIHDGDSFTYRDVVSLNTGVSQDYLIETPNTSTWAHFGYELEGQSEVDLAIYEATDKTGTTPQTVFNRNRNSNNVATTLLSKGTSGGTTDGTLIMQRTSGSATSAGKFAAAVGEGQERVLRQGTKYIFRITSQGNGNKISIRLSWYEHVNV